MAKKRVAVIGAGVAGLVTLRYLAGESETIVPTAFDRRSEVGGLWNYSDETGTDKYGLPVPNNLYKSLVTNIPKDVMCYPDVPFDSDLPKFMHFQHVRTYLENFADKFDVKRYIKFQRLVTSVKPCRTPKGDTWLVTTRDTSNDNISTDTFDAVIVCNGVQSLTHTPDIPGLGDFRGSQLHSKDYRDPELYRDKKVIVVGASFSSWEIVSDVKDVASKIYVSCRSSTYFKFTSIRGVEMVGGIKQILPNGIILENGECKEVDVIFFATGYLFHLPFLAPECNLQIKNDRITPLFRHMFHSENPSLMFINFMKRVPHFQASDLQARYACAVLRGDVILPPEGEMKREEEEDYQRRVVKNGLSENFMHFLCGPNAFRNYADLLTKDANLKPLEDEVRGFSLSLCSRPAEYEKE